MNKYFAGNTIIIDGTSPSEESRRSIADLVLKNDRTVTYLWINIPEKMSKYLNSLRAHSGGRHVPDIAYRVYNKKFQPIVARRGETIITVDKFPLDEKKIISAVLDQQAQKILLF